MYKKILSLVLAVLMIAGLCACKKPVNPNPAESKEESMEIHDYVSELKLNMNSVTKKMEAKVKCFIDGDTVHFYVDEKEIPGGVLKARFIAINTPESTGKIEEYGKAASNFTKERLSQAVSIILESDDDLWNKDSTGGRYLVWIWYKTASDADYRNLNLEILQNGLCIASGTGQNRYGDICTSALAQAKFQKLNVYSGEKDPLFFYGDAVELTLPELRKNISEYNGVKVAFEGNITRGYDNSVYIEEYDPEDDRYYGMAIYIGFNLSGQGQAIMRPGNRVRVVGTVSFWETGGTYQVSGLTYRAIKPDDPDNIQLISDGVTPAYVPTEAALFSDSEYCALALDTTVSVSNLLVTDYYMTKDTASDDYGALTLTCKAEDGSIVKVRTVPLKDDTGELIPGTYYQGKHIDVRGLVAYYEGYQVKLFATTDINIID